MKMTASRKRDNHQHTHTQNRYAVLPVAARLDADTGLTGNGVTVAFIDAGFYPHPDLTRPHNRIIAVRWLEVALRSIARPVDREPPGFQAVQRRQAGIGERPRSESAEPERPVIQESRLR
jgi:hypothetical protein